MFGGAARGVPGSCCRVPGCRNCDGGRMMVAGRTSMEFVRRIRWRCFWFLVLSFRCVLTTNDQKPTTKTTRSSPDAWPKPKSQALNETKRMANSQTHLLQFTDRGIFCPRAGVYLDPWKPVERAIISHGHSDHAYPGHKHYLCTTDALPVIRHRLYLIDNIQGLPYGEVLSINGVAFSFHPAGHIPGSAQIKVAYKGEVWVFSGDYKLQHDGISAPFEPVRCQVFITESTFGLPVYKWKPQAEVFDEINEWWRKNKHEGKTSVITGYTGARASESCGTSISPSERYLPMALWTRSIVSCARMASRCRRRRA